MIKKCKMMFMRSKSDLLVFSSNIIAVEHVLSLLKLKCVVTFALYQTEVAENTRE